MQIWQRNSKANDKLQRSCSQSYNLRISATLMSAVWHSYITALQKEKQLTGKLTKAHSSTVSTIHPLEINISLKRNIKSVSISYTG